MAFYTGTLASFAVYAANGHLFWLNLAIAFSVGGAVLAAVPGLVDWAFGIPRDSAAKMIGLAHAALNVTALGLFAVVIGEYVTNWNGPAAGAALGVVLSAIGVAVTVAAGFLDWTLVQDYHIGIQLAPEQELAEPTVQHHQPPIPLRCRHAA